MQSLLTLQVDNVIEQATVQRVSVSHQWLLLGRLRPEPYLGLISP